MEGIKWRGKPIEDLSREELLKVVEFLIDELGREQKDRRFLYKKKTREKGGAR